MSGAEMREIIGALESQAEQTWSSHQATSLNEMNGVAGDALEKPETKFARWTNGRI